MGTFARRLEPPRDPLEPTNDGVMRMRMANGLLVAGILSMVAAGGLLACGDASTASAPVPAATQAPDTTASFGAKRTLVTFEGSFDAATKRLEIVYRTPLGAVIPSSQVDSVTPQTALPYGTGASQVYFNTQAGSVAWGGACGTNNLCGQVRAMNGYSSPISGMTAVIDSMSGTGVTAVGAPYTFGTVPANSQSLFQLWTFNNPTGANFTFQGHADGIVSSAPTPTYFWFDASNTSSITKAGNSVTGWNDVSGLGRNATVPGGSAAPTYAATGGPSSLPAIQFNGSNVRLATGNVNTVSALTIFTVFKMSTQQQWGSIANQNHDTYWSIRMSDPCCGGGTNNLNFHIQNNNSAPLLAIATGSWKILTTMRETSPPRSTMYYDQASPQTVIADVLTAGSPQPITLGNAIAASQSMGGYIAEMRAYNTALSASDRTLVETELKTKWGL